MLEPSTNELVRQMLDGYKVLMTELRLIKFDTRSLLRGIITKADTKQIDEAREQIKSLTYGRHSS